MVFRPSATQRLRGEEGTALVMVALLGTALLVLSMLVVSRTTLSANRTTGDRSTEEALFVAESATDQGLARISTNSAFATVSGSTDLSSKAAVVAAADALVAGDPTALQQTSDGDFVVVRAVGSDKVYGVGFSPGIDSPVRRARVVEATTITTSAAGGCWPEAAIIGTGLIESGGFTLNTVPSGQHTANIIGNFDFKGSSDGYIDGDISVVGNVNNQPAGNVYGDIESGMSPPLGFPTDAELTAWENELIAEAQAGGTIPGIDLSAPMTIDAPVYIDGSVQLHSGAVLTINGPGTVYVNGHFEQGGASEVYNGAMLVVRDFFKQGGGTHYEITGSPADAGLLSFYENKDAIEFYGPTNGELFGLVYSARGGVKVQNAGVPLQGAFVSSGVGANGLIKFSGGMTINYPSGLLGSVTWLPDITGGPGGGCGGGWEDSAFVSNGDIKLGGTQVLTNPADGHFADIHANGNIDFSGGAYVDGDVSASGTSDPGASAYGTISSGETPVEFPTQAEINAWEAELKAEAQAGGTMAGADLSGDVTINTPMYVNGDLKISGSSSILRLVGNGTLYVEGKFLISSAATLNNDGVAVSSDILKLSGGSEYQITGTPSQTLLASFAYNIKALELSGGSSGFSQGIAYAPNGGIRLGGGGEWHGGLVAGGSSGLGMIESSGGETIRYPSGLLSGNQVLPGAANPPTTETIALVSRREL